MEPSKSVVGRAVGVMVGSSLDGMDMAMVRWDLNHPSRFVIEKTATVALPAEWTEWIERRRFAAHHYCTLHREEIRFSRWAAHRLAAFIGDQQAVDVIGFHGPTLYHDETGPLSYQLGDGAFLYGELKVPVVVGFREVDQALGAPGAPILPYVEHLAFPQYDGVLNLGGIVNISFRGMQPLGGKDIAPCNQLLNRLAQEAGMPYDDEGKLARGGRVNPLLLEKLLQVQCEWVGISLDRKEISEVYWPLLEECRPSPLADRLRTVVEFIARVVAQQIPPEATVMVTGGGAHNRFLVERIQALASGRVEVPDPAIVEYKEALLIGLMALLRLHRRPNTYATYQSGVTAGALWGAPADPHCH